jgi:hypothetical protein
VFAQLLGAITSGSPKERATAIAILVSTAGAVFLVVGSFAAVAAFYRGLAGTDVLVGIIAFAVAWMAFVLLGDLVLAKLFGAS